MTPNERRQKVKELRESGMTFRSIGEQMGFGAERARALYVKSTRKDRKDSELCKLHSAGENVDIRINVSNRTINILTRNGIDTIEKLKSLKLSDAKRMWQVGEKVSSEIAWFKRRVSK